MSTSSTSLDISTVINDFFKQQPDADNPAQRVAFGTSGHRGSSSAGTFNEAHILAITQAIVDIRAENELRGPIFVGRDTHALSEPAFQTTIEVLAANKCHVVIEENSPFTPTPVVSHSILMYNRRHNGPTRADGIIITPSHNPPCDGGIKYNPPTGGPAPSDLTKQIEKRANDLLRNGNRAVLRTDIEDAFASGLVQKQDLIGEYINDLRKVIDLEAIKDSGLSIGADPLGGSTIHVWERIADRYRLPITVTSTDLDPTFNFVPPDHDGKVRMDCSSPFAMAGLLKLKDTYDLAFACDPDADRHGIVSKGGLMNPNHYLSVVAWHLFKSRGDWTATAGIGKTIVTSSMLDRIANSLGRRLFEVPVGFKWFVPYLLRGICAMGCEESAGASFLDFQGLPWSTDKDGPLLCLLAAEIMAKHQKTPTRIYNILSTQFGAPAYARADSPLTPSRRAKFSSITKDSYPQDTLAGEKVTQILTQAPANGESIGGLKVCTENGWFAARPSGTEPICKVYTESFLGEEHRQKIQEEAVSVLETMLK